MLWFSTLERGGIQTLVFFPFWTLPLVSNTLCLDSSHIEQWVSYYLWAPHPFIEPLWIEWLTLLMVVVGSVKQIVRLGARFWWLLSRRGRKAFIRSGLNSDLVNLHRKAINLFQSNVKRKNVSQKCYIASRWKDFQFYNFADSWDWLYISVISTFHWKFNNLRKFKSKCSASSNWLEL